MAICRYVFADRARGMRLVDALTRAAYEGDLDGVTRLLESGTDPNSGSALMVAAGRGWHSLTEKLLEAGADPNAVDSEGITPLWAAIHSRSAPTLAALLRHGASKELLSAPGPRTPLMHATIAHFKQGVLLLLESGAEINASSVSGETALSLAIKGEAPDLASILITYGAKVDQTFQPDFTPLTLSVRRGYARLVEELLRRGADPDDCTQSGWSPLSIAAFQGHTEILRILLAAGANPNGRDHWGRTPLMWASWRAFPRCYHLLRSYGADPTLRAQEGAVPESAPLPPRIRRHDRPLSISLRQRLGIGALWFAARRTSIMGISVGLCGLSREEGNRALTAMDRALRLLEKYNPRQFRHTVRSLKRVLIVTVPGPSAMVFPGFNWCVLRWLPAGTDKQVVLHLCQRLVHETTHVRLFNLRFGYDPLERLRIERVCIKVALACVRRLPDSNESTRELENLLERLRPSNLDGDPSVTSENGLPSESS